VTKIHTLETLIPHVEKIFAAKLRDGVEFAEHKGIEHATTCSRFRNAERFSDSERGVRRRVVPEQLRNMVFYGTVHLGNLLDLVQDFRLASVIHLAAKKSWPPSHPGCLCISLRVPRL
jgi:hypothetical protein